MVGPPTQISKGTDSIVTWKNFDVPLGHMTSLGLELVGFL